jgi:hypothetical protein
MTIVYFHFAGGVGCGGAGGGAWLPPWSGGNMPSRNSPRTPALAGTVIFDSGQRGKIITGLREKNPAALVRWRASMNAVETSPVFQISPISGQYITVAAAKQLLILCDFSILLLPLMI